MTKIIPFKAIRPTRDKVQLVASRPYYTYTQQMLDAKLDGNPYTFMHIINPEFREEIKTEPNTPERFQKVRNKFDEFVHEGIFIQDESPCFYIYKQTTPNNTYVGIVAGASIEELNSNKIKKHEATLTEREETFSNYLKIVEFNAEPVLLFHEKREVINEFILKHTFERPEYEYTTTDRIKHELWIIQNESEITELTAYFDDLPATYIADGHHRSASSARFYEDALHKTNENAHFLAFFISEDTLNIMDYNRLVTDLNGKSHKELIEDLEEQFIVTPLKNKLPSPIGLHNIVMYIENQWYNLQAKEGTFNRENPVENLDTHILTKNILEPLFNIHDLKTDKRIQFMSGDKGMQGLKNAVDKGKYAVAFGLYPVLAEQLKEVADAELIMPPKSTWIEPKLRSGLTIYPLK